MTENVAATEAEDTVTTEPMEPEIKQAPTEPVGNLTPVAPAVVTGEARTYAIANLVRRAIDPTWDAGLETEIAQELRNRQPWRTFEGTPIPDFGAVEKANSAISGGNMNPLTGTDYADQLFAHVGTAISRQDLVSLLGVATIESNEMTVQVPTQSTPMTAGHVAIDGTIPTSSDATFVASTMSPKLYGAVTTVNLSAIFAQHPQAGSPDYIGQELRRAMTTERNRVFISGDETTNSEEYDGILIQSTDSTASPSASSITLDAAANALFESVRNEMEAYVQSTDTDGMLWVLDHHVPSVLQNILKFTGATLADAGLNNNMLAGLPIIRATNLPVNTTPTPDTAPGFLIAEPRNIVACNFGGSMDLTVNPWADAVYSKAAVMMRIYGLHGLHVVDTAKILRFTTDIA